MGPIGFWQPQQLGSTISGFRLIAAKSESKYLDADFIKHLFGCPSVTCDSHFEAGPVNLRATSWAPCPPHFERGAHKHMSLAD
jgi:hypothetical protein